MTTTCTCGTKPDGADAFCSSCGRPIVRPRFCGECGSTLESSDAFCGSCGRPTSIAPPSGETGEPSAPGSQPQKTGTPAPSTSPLRGSYARPLSETVERLASRIGVEFEEVENAPAFSSSSRTYIHRETDLKVLLGAAVLSCLGVFLPWVSGTIPFVGSVTVRGSQAAIGWLIAITSAGFGAYAWRCIVRKDGYYWGWALTAAILTELMALSQFAALGSLVEDIEESGAPVSVQPQLGLVLVAAGPLVALICLARLRRGKSGLYQRFGPP